MWVSKKDFEELKKKVEEQNNILDNMSLHMIKMQEEINELKKPKEPNYFG